MSGLFAFRGPPKSGTPPALPWVTGAVASVEPRESPDFCPIPRTRARQRCHAAGDPENGLRCTMPRRFSLPSTLLSLALLLASSSVLSGCGAASESPTGAGATCQGPDGPPVPLKSAVTQDAYAGLSGRWDLCSGNLVDMPAGTVGVDFNGQWVDFLVLDAYGNAVRSGGRTVQLKLNPTTGSLTVVLADGTGAFTAYTAELTSQPRRLRLVDSATGTAAHFGAPL